MRKVLTSFGFGAHAAYLDVTQPTFGRYAARWGYDLFVPQEGFFRFVESRWKGLLQRPHSWWKVPLLHFLLRECGYDIALWLDADVCVCRFDRDIMADMPGWAGDQDHHPEVQGMVWHRVDVGAIPNCGVWVVSGAMVSRGYLANLWDQHDLITHGWWEQAANMRLMGVNPLATPCHLPSNLNPVACETAKLPYEWNPHVRDGRGVPGDARFKHATMIPDRLSALKDWSRTALNS